MPMHTKNIVTICLTIVLFVIALLGVVSCTSYQSDYPWGAEQNSAETVSTHWSETNGIKTRLIPQKKTYTLGQPIMFRLEMTNIDTAPISYDAQGIDVNDQMLIKDAKGGVVKYTDTFYQTASSSPHPTIMPKEVVCLFSDFDIAMQYHICKPGKYTIQFKGKDEAFGKAIFPASNIVEIEIKDGKLNDFDTIRCRLLHIMPADWGMYLTDSFCVHEELVRLKKEGLVIEKYFIMLLPPQKGTVHQMLVWHTRSPTDMSKVKHDEKSVFSTSVAEYLGQDQWGYVYWEYTPEAIKLWPRAKEEIIKVLGVKSPVSDNSIKYDINYYYAQAEDALHDSRFEDAIQYYEKALTLNPNDASAYYNLGIIYDEKLDNPAKANFCYNKYLELAPADASDREKVKKWIDNLKKRLRTKKQGKFTDGLLKAFPDLYERLATPDASERFNLLQQVTALDGTDFAFSPKYVHKEAVTNTDIANLINEVLRDGLRALTAYQKMAIVDIIIGYAYPFGFSSSRRPYGTGWHTPIPEAEHWIMEFLKEPPGLAKPRSPGFVTDAGTPVIISGIEECVKEHAIGSIPRNEETVPVLINLLIDKCYRVRCYAVEILAGIGGPEAVPQITKRLDDPDEQVRMSAIRALGQLNAVKTIPLIRRHLKDKGWGARIAAAGTLAQLGSKESIHEIMELLKDKKDNVRRFTIHALQELDAKESIPEIRKLLQDNYACFSAMDALVHFRDNESVDEIIKLLKNENTNIREKSASALADLGAKEAMPEITKLLADKNEYVRSGAIRALADIGGKDSIHQITELLKDKNGYVRYSVVLALARLKAQEVIPEIVELLKNDDREVRMSAASALGGLGAREFIPTLLQLLKAEKEFRCGDIAESLAMLDAKEAIPEISTLLKHNDYGVRQDAVFALGRLRARDTIPEIMQLLDDKSVYVRGGAVIALVELGEKNKVPKEAIANIGFISACGGFSYDYSARAKAAQKELGVEEESGK